MCLVVIDDFDGIQYMDCELCDLPLLMDDLALAKQNGLIRDWRVIV